MKVGTPLAETVISLQEMRVLDRDLEYHGVSIEKLMERAGAGVADALRSMGAKGKRVAFFSGTGNNAGDGFVAARLLAEEADVTVVLAKPETQIGRGPAKKAFAALPSGVRVLEPPMDYAALAEEADVLVDALLGTGISGRLRAPYRTMVEAMNGAGKPLLSIDLPSGWGADLVVRPTHTVALHAEKEGMDEATCGEIRVVDIGITPDQERLVGPGEFFLYPRPGLDAHKGDNGLVLIVAGGPYTGAPALAGLAAYRIGSDVVHVATPAVSHPVVAGFSPGLIVHRLPGEILVPDSVERLLELAQGKDAVAIGPGLGRDPETLQAVRSFLQAVEIPVAIDADAITAVAEDLGSVEGTKGVVTPHKTEFHRLSGEALPDDPEARIAKVQSFAADLGMTVLLKGRHDVISDGTRTKVNVTGNPGMAVGGTGDVLAGLVAGLMGKGLSPFDAARLAAFANGYAGDRAFDDLSYGMMATDVLDRLPAVLKEFL